MSFIPSLPLHYSALGASTGALAQHLHFISKKPLYDFVWSYPAPSVRSTLAKLSKLLKYFSHIWREVPADSRAQNPVRDISPVLSCIWTDTESKEPCQWHLSTGRTIMNLFSDTQRIENHWPQISAPGWLSFLLMSTHTQLWQHRVGSTQLFGLSHVCGLFYSVLFLPFISLLPFYLVLEEVQGCEQSLLSFWLDQTCK